MADPISFRIDSKAKKAAYKVFNQVGLKPSQAVNLFFYQVGIQGKIPFEIVGDIPNQKTIDAFRESEEPGKLSSHHDFKKLRREPKL